MAKRKKKKKRESRVESVDVIDVLPLDSEPTSPPRKRGGFFWGMTLGFIVTLAVVVANDLGWSVLPQPAPGAATAGPPTVSASAAGTPLLLAGSLPPGSELYIDGHALRGEATGFGTMVTVPEGAQRFEVRGTTGALWTTSLTGSLPDTLYPRFGGDLVVEAGRQSPQGSLWIDGHRVGDAPGTVSGVALGWHLLSIRDGERVLYEDAVVIRDGEVTLVNVPPLPPRGKGRMVVRTRVLESHGFREAQGLPVWIDGTLRGETPFEATLAGGFHSVRIEQEDGSSRVEVVYLEAGSSRYVNAEFGGKERLQIRVSAPMRAAAGSPLAIPVHVSSSTPHDELTQANLHLVRPGQSKPLAIPLVPSGIGEDWWVAVLPEDLVTAGTLVGYAACVDQSGRSGDSDLFSLRVN